MRKSCFSVLLFLTLSLNLRSHTNIFLSQTPWKYKKIEPAAQNISSVLGDINRNIQLRSILDDDLTTGLFINENFHELVIDLGDEFQLSKLIIKFDKQVQSAAYSVEGSLIDHGSWEMLADYSKSPHECHQKISGSMGSIGETVGYISDVKYVYVDPNIYGTARFLRLKFESVFLEPTSRLEIKDIDIFVRNDRSTDEEEKFYEIAYDDSTWETVGIPHTYNDQDSYLNSTSTFIWKGDVWYRNNFHIAKKYKNKRFYIEFKSVGIAAAVYINGKFKEGNTEVPQNGNLTHVGCFIPFIVDVTDELEVGRDNLLAVQISNAPNSFFTWPTFGVWEAFGMGWGGIYSDVILHIVDDIHIPQNIYSVSNEWGTYNAVKEVNLNQAELVFHTNIKNSSDSERNVDLVYELIDDSENVVSKV